MLIFYRTSIYANIVLHLQSKAIRIINNLNLIKSLQPLSHRRLVGDLSIFCRYFHRHCSQEIRAITPVLLRRFRTTRGSTHSHPFQFSLPTPRTISINHHSSQVQTICGACCLLLAFLNPTTCPLSLSRSSFFLCWGFV